MDNEVQRLDWGRDGMFETGQGDFVYSADYLEVLAKLQRLEVDIAVAEKALVSALAIYRGGVDGSR